MKTTIATILKKSGEELKTLLSDPLYDQVGMMGCGKIDIFLKSQITKAVKEAFEAVGTSEAKKKEFLK